MNKTAGIITAEERRMMRDYILLTHIHTMVHKSIDDLQFTDSILRDTYLLFNEHIEGMVFMDLKIHRLALKHHGIQVTKEEHSKDGFVIYYYYTCRGYTDRLGLTRDVMKSEISIRLGKYVEAVADVLKPK
ncbi:hypothetical protein [Paenibacillus vini]|uniref:Uncharacterized protein n=1 Tax=Paenibacillus vini TaxID=1476024 RepID=A0ABQ4MJJ6_9BACL|nr:hypothetical protein [Paenibacillus vini]GIP56166.1 hypothetical protein J42TS3_52010 [Paenibacillus vini]